MGFAQEVLREWANRGKKPGPDAPRPQASEGWIAEFLAFFNSALLAVVLMLLIGVGSSVGTVLPQDQGPRVILESQFPEWVKQALLLIKAHDVYHSFWFNFLLALLFINLAVGTYVRFPPIWRRLLMDRPRTPPLANLPERLALGMIPGPTALASLQKRGYAVQALPEGGYFLERDKWVRWGPTLIHLSLFLIIIGAMWGGLRGIKASLPILPGEGITGPEVVEAAFLKGSWPVAPRPFRLQLEDFRIELRPSGQAKQYYSQVRIEEPGQPPRLERVWVNEPLIVDGVYFYQSFWGIGALRCQVGKGPTQRMPLQQAKVGGYMSKPFRVGQQEVMWFLRSMEEPAILVETKAFKPLGQLVPGLSASVGGERLSLDRYELYSGFEAKADPGIPLVYAGCGLLILGLVLLPFAHQELWLRPDEAGQWWLVGRAHKGHESFRRTMLALGQAFHTGLEHQAPPPPAAPLGA